MVYYKRKPVPLHPPPPALPPGAAVWLIGETNEVFTTYDAFLARMAFYQQRQFVCEGTGHSALTFFEALASERAFAEEVDRQFPEALREPVLRRVQFSTTPRVDHLVDEVYEDLKSDFYPGEHVTVLLEDGTRLQGTVREKARYPQLLDPAGNVARRATSKYLVRLTGGDHHGEEALLADHHLLRDRRVFTKAILRGFIRNCVSREPWAGAPWTVKRHVAEVYHIDTQVPRHLQFEHARAKAVAARGGRGGTPAKRQRSASSASSSARPTPEGVVGAYAGGEGASQSRGSGRSRRRGRDTAQADTVDESRQGYDMPQGVNGESTIENGYLPVVGGEMTPDPPPPSMRPVEASAMLVDRTCEAVELPPEPPALEERFDHIAVPTLDNSYNNPIQAAAAIAAATATASSPSQPPQPYDTPRQLTLPLPPATPTPLPPPPTIRYPIEDLDLPHDPSASPRPHPHFLHATTTTDPPTPLDAATVGRMLEIWTTLSVHAELLRLSAFTFDEFVDALGVCDVPGEGGVDGVGRCELLVEVHCALLKLLVEPEGEGGGLVVELPPLPEEEEEEEEEESESDDEEASDSDDSAISDQPTRRITRSRTIARAEAAAAAAATTTSTPSSPTSTSSSSTAPHCAASFFPTPTAWLTRLARRDLSHGGWELCLLALLHRLTHSPLPHLSAPALAALTALAPPTLPHAHPRGQLLARAPALAAQRYKRALGVRGRVSALGALVWLAAETPGLRGWLDECAARSTELRKEKTEAQRQRKIVLGGVRRLVEEKRAVGRGGGGGVVEVEVEAEGEGDDEEEEGEDDDASVSGDEASQRYIGKKRRKGAKLNGKEKSHHKRASSIDSNTTKPKHRDKPNPTPHHDTQATLAALTAAIASERARIKDYERAITAYDAQLRELDKARTRCLGTDRFWNRYYWFERNGVARERLPGGYTNGRLWVLGPHPPELAGFIEHPDAVDAAGLTVRRRREIEEGALEGSGGVLKPNEWAYYAAPEELDALISWLDARGVREAKLRKELLAFRAQIETRMRARLAELAADEPVAGGAAAASAAAVAEDAGEESSDEPRPRVATRTQALRECEREMRARHRCLRWRNEVAVRELGHLHVESAVDVGGGGKGGRKRRLVSGTSGGGGGGVGYGSRAASGDETGTEAESPVPAERKRRRR